MAREMANFIIVSFALTVLACGAATLPADEDDVTCRGGHCLADESAATAMLQQSFAKTANTGTSAQGDVLRRAARDAQEHQGRPLKRLPPFPTLSPANAAELPWPSHDEFLEESLGREDDDEDAKAHVVGKGVATVVLDSMSRPLAPDLLQKPPQAKHAAPSKPRAQMVQKPGSSKSMTARQHAEQDEIDERNPSEDSAADVSLSSEEGALDESSYKALSAKRNHKEMKSFVRRMISKLGYHATSEGDLDGFVAYYSGKKGVQSVKRMQKEIHQIASKKGKGHWIVAR